LSGSRYLARAEQVENRAILEQAPQPPSRTNLERSPANNDENIASGLLSIMA
jgi:hypothetical protein